MVHSRSLIPHRKPAPCSWANVVSLCLTDHLSLCHVFSLSRLGWAGAGSYINLVYGASVAASVAAWLRDPVRADRSSMCQMPGPVPMPTSSHWAGGIAGGRRRGRCAERCVARRWRRLPAAPAPAPSRTAPLGLCSSAPGRCETASACRARTRSHPAAPCSTAPRVGHGPARCSPAPRTAASAS